MIWETSLVHEREQAEEIPRKWFVRSYKHVERNVVEGPCSAFGVESKGELLSAVGL